MTDQEQKKKINIDLTPLTMLLVGPLLILWTTHVLRPEAPWLPHFDYVQALAAYVLVRLLQKP